MATVTDLYKLTAAGQQAGAQQQNAQNGALIQAAKLQNGQAAATNLSDTTAQWLSRLSKGTDTSLAQQADAGGLNLSGQASGLTGDNGARVDNSGGAKSAKDQAKEYLDTVMGNSGIVGSWSGYPISQNVIDAQNILNDVLASRPGAYEGKYDEQIASLYDQIMNREKFVYDVNKDPMYRQYRNQYMQNGQRAMQDTIGQAAALAGGYGSSWGTTAGFQAYQQYLQALNDKIPELEQRAFERYQYEGDELRNNMSLSLDMDTRDYGRYRDTVEDWKDDRTFEYGRYRDAMQDWKDDRAFEYGVYRDSVSDYYNDRNFGWTMYDAEANREMTNYWNQKNYDLEVQKFLASNSGKSSGGGGGSGSSGSSYSGSTKTTATKKTTDTTQATKNIWEGLNTKDRVNRYNNRTINKAV